MIPIMVLRNKTNPERYLAANIDVGDWEDENLDVTLEDIQNAYMIIRKDLAVPTLQDFEEHKNFHAEMKRMLIEKFGPDPFISLDFESVCEAYEPFNTEITQEQYDFAKELME
ncbi:hypothetical protein DFQ01_103217 [Paenibacillus cellulosilyticus]|uniref:Uncharacterized protein n=1 Tax=Paenibacillus cellulosilyticus TaxID=375489 RepID=A0A2V2YZU5_9BACL|nr:hypothetical protein [Paenibacillus cellulosilyticus]PWW06315.1 hypothetical protein DFQ01_103217 [Paenibacillus cellulosilyticus]QKS42941.1 hypothetical protein HUB94_00115 [Paenibacillus cellulosilyticus]